LARLLARGKYEEAEKYCSRLKGKKQKECRRILGDVFFDKADYSKAIFYYEKVSYKKGFDKIGLVYFEKGDYAEAVKYFEKGTPSPQGANAYAAMADDYRTEKNNKELAKKYYTKAIDEYEYFIKDYHYAWDLKDSEQRRKCIDERDLLPKSPEESAQQLRLQRLLEKAADYCDRLEKNFSLFFCREVITEYINLSWDNVIDPQTGTYYNIPPIKDKYVYEYQLIREDKKVSESRTLLEINGVKKNIPDSQLMNRNRYEKLIFGPIAFLSRFWQQCYDYKILREDTLRGEKVVVIEAIPRRVREYNPLVGTIWIKEDDPGQGDVLKLEWNPKTILKNFEKILKHEKIYKAKLAITFFAEFNVNRKGFRLPSRYYIEYAYIKKNKKKFVRTQTNVIFNDHRYFTVSSEVTKSEGKLK
jgi:tetratricopeptide (TPR) repeat protein